MQVALNQLEATAEQISGEDIELEFEDGVMVYEIELIYQGTEYDFEIDAKSGVCRIASTDSDAQIPSDAIVDHYETDTVTLIGNDQAQEAALNHAGVKRAEAKNLHCELDLDDGNGHYDVEFDSGDYEFSYEINAANGKVISHEKERKD